MPAPRISYKQWVRLYDLADEFYTLAPWEWMNEEDLIGLKHPGTDEMGYISIMGANGEYRCLTVYLGEEALHRFNLIHNPPEGDDSDLTETDKANLILETRQLHAAIETRDLLEKVELDQIRRLKRRYRGDNWPQFQSHRPGHCPGPINAEDLEWLTLALERTLACAVSFQDRGYDDLMVEAKAWVMPCQEYVEGEWQQKLIPYDNTLFSFPTPKPSELLVAKVGSYDRGPVIQCRCCMLTTQIGSKFGDRQFPYLLLAVDPGSDFVLGVELLSVKKQSHEELVESVPDHFLRMFDKYGICPGEIHVSDYTTGMFLHETSKALACKIEFELYLPALEDAMASLPV